MTSDDRCKNFPEKKEKYNTSIYIFHQEIYKHNVTCHSFVIALLEFGIFFALFNFKRLKINDLKFGGQRNILYLCSVIEELFEHDVNDPGRNAPTCLETIWDMHRDYLRHPLKTSETQAQIIQTNVNPKFLNSLIV